MNTLIFFIECAAVAKYIFFIHRAVASEGERDAR